MIGHEVGHLFGYEHADGGHAGLGILDRVAYSQEVHKWITRQAYAHFADQFGVSGLEPYLETFVQGALDEDEPGRNPFGQTLGFLGLNHRVPPPLLGPRLVVPPGLRRRIVSV